MKTTETRKEETAKKRQKTTENQSKGTKDNEV